jgi:hypothetical protein
MKATHFITVFAAVAILALVTGVSSAQTNYALSKSYTSDPLLTPSGTWWLGENQPYATFTDGFSQWAGWSARGWQGPDNVQAATLTIDLGAAQADISSVTVDIFVSVGSAVRGATDVKVSGSLNGSTFTDWGAMTVPFDHTANPEATWVGTWTGGPQNARYVRLVVDWTSEWAGAHKLLQEISVFGASSVQDWESY